MSTEFISLLPPPGSAIYSYIRNEPSSSPPDGVPSIFVEAMSVRESVFVREQKVPLENELDDDDARSYHWVVYASVSNSSAREDGRKGSQTAAVPVGTIRLVPPPHAGLEGHPIANDQHRHDTAESSSEADHRHHQSTEDSASHEPYIKLGRLATLSAYRGLGLGRLLVTTALEWASLNAETIVPPWSPASREAAHLDGHTLLEEKRWKGLVLVHAQKSVEQIWAKMGFKKDERLGEWIEEGIVHVGMWRRIPINEKL